MLRPERPRGRPAESHDPARDLVPNLARDRDQDHVRGHIHLRVHGHVHVHVQHPNLDHRLDRARVLSRVRRLNRAVNRDLVPSVLNRGTRRDLDPSRNRAREPLRSHRRDLGRARGPSPDRGQDRDPVPVAVAVPLARAAKAAPRASESRSVIDFKSNLIISTIVSTSVHLYRCYLRTFWIVILPTIRIIAYRANRE